LSDLSATPLAPEGLGHFPVPLLEGITSWQKTLISLQKEGWVCFVLFCFQPPSLTTASSDLDLNEEKLTLSPFIAQQTGVR